MPLLFILANHNALAVKESMLPTELPFAYFDDVHVVSNPDKTRSLHNLLEDKLAHVGTQLHIGKTKTWKKQRSPNNDDLETRFGTRRPVCVADSPSMRWPQVSSLPQNSVQSAEYAEGHDHGMWRDVEGVLGDSLAVGGLTSVPMRLRYEGLIFSCGTDRGQF